MEQETEQKKIKTESKTESKKTDVEPLHIDVAKFFFLLLKIDRRLHPERYEKYIIKE